MTPIKSVFLIGLSEIKHINHAIEWASHQIGDYLIFKSDVSNFAIKTLIKLWSLFHFLQVPKHNVGVCGTSQNMLSFVDTIKFAGYFYTLIISILWKMCTFCQLRVSNNLIRLSCPPVTSRLSLNLILPILAWCTPDTSCNILLWSTSIKDTLLLFVA